MKLLSIRCILIRGLGLYPEPRSMLKAKCRKRKLDPRSSFLLFTHGRLFISLNARGTRFHVGAERVGEFDKPIPRYASRDRELSRNR